LGEDLCRLRGSRRFVKDGRYSMSIIAFDFACGVGGTTKGMQLAGIQVAKGVDIDPSCRKTYERNCRPSKFVEADIRNINLDELFRGITINREDKILFAACLPCQPFSRQGRLDEKDERITLTKAFLRLVKKGNPDFVFSENVPGFQKAFGGRPFNSFLRGLRRMQYEYCYGTIKAELYGIAQRRRRFILLASKHGKPTFPAPTHGRGGKPYRTVRDVIGALPPLRAGERDSRIPNHEAASLSPLNMKRMRNTPKSGGCRLGWAPELVLPCHRNWKGYADVYGRMEWDKPAPTLTTRCISFSNGRFGHPEQDRAISVREAAAIQGFGLEFVFLSPFSVAAKHVGNAVPPPLAQALIKSLLRPNGREP
jgi:DNA (cytosine-5)-methyltransferase 1